MATQYNSTSYIVDDNDPAISYSNGWVLGGTSAEYDGTRHGATQAGMTATFTFTGVSIAVYGPLASYDVYGVPVSSYSVDGEDIATYNSPIVPPPLYYENICFFQSPTLIPGQHTLVITNTNGTAPSELWIDYLIYTPGGATSSPTSTPPTSPPPSTPSAPTSPNSNSSPPITNTSPGSNAVSQTPMSHASNSASSETSTEGTSTNAPMTFGGSAVPSAGGLTAQLISTAATTSGSVTPTTGSDVGRSSTPVGAIAGGVAGGVVGLALVLAIFLYFWRRIGAGHAGAKADLFTPVDADVDPFASWRDHTREAVSSALHQHKSPLPTSTGGMSIDSGPSQHALPRDAGGAITHQHQDSGIRVAAPSLKLPIVDIPPAYSND